MLGLVTARSSEVSDMAIATRSQLNNWHDRQYKINAARKRGKQRKALGRKLNLPTSKAELREFAKSAIERYKLRHV